MHFPWLRFLALALALIPNLALAQSYPTWPFGYIPTPQEWQYWWGKKQDYNPNLGCTFSPCSMGITATPNSVLGTNGQGTPSFSPVLPSGISLQNPQFVGSNASGALNGSFSILTTNNATIGGQVSVTNTTPSTGTTTGAAVIAGGLGIGGAVNVGGAGVFSSLSAGSANLTGYAGIAPTVTWSGGRQNINSGIYEVGTWTGTAALAGQSPIFVEGYAAPLNLVDCASDTLNIPEVSGNTTGSDCLLVNHYFGGSAAIGSRNGLSVDLELTAPTGNGNSNDFYNGILTSERADSNDNGTSGAPAGYLGGLSSQTTLACTAWNTANCATNFATVHGGGEFDLAVLCFNAGLNECASVNNKVGQEINLAPGDAVQGSNIDAGMLFTDYGNVQWKYGIEFGTPSGQGGQFPVGGTLIGAYSGQSNEGVSYGIDFSNITMSVCQFKGSGICIDEWGRILTSQSSNPTVACTGLGTGGTCDLTSAGPASDSAGVVVLHTGSASPGVTGQVTLTFGHALGANAPVCMFMPQSGASNWPNPDGGAANTLFFIASVSPSAISMDWSVSSALVTSSTYAIEYRCVGR